MLVGLPLVTQRTDQLAINRKDKLSMVYGHVKQQNHNLAFEKARVIGRANDKMARLMLESWSSTGTLNRALDLHPAYKALRTRLESVRARPSGQSGKVTRGRQPMPAERFVEMAVGMAMLLVLLLMSGLPTAYATPYMNDPTGEKVNTPLVLDEHDADHQYADAEFNDMGPTTSEPKAAYLSLNDAAAFIGDAALTDPDLRALNDYVDSDSQLQAADGDTTDGIPLNDVDETGSPNSVKLAQSEDNAAQTVSQQHEMQGQTETEPPSEKLEDAPGATVEAPRQRSRRAATASKLHIWADGVIPYIIDRALYPSPPTIKRILKAIRVWENGTCVIFVEKEPKHRTYINFTIEACGCCSFIGLKCSGSPQTVSLAPSCATEGMVLHQLGHVLGFYHEQSRPDRDDYVEIFQDNIRPEAWINFEKKHPSIIDSLGEPYDYDSIMHYDSFSNAKPGRNETMRPKKCCPRPQIGKWVKPSPGDIRQVNKLYKCRACGQTLMEYTGTFASPQSESPPPTTDSNANTTASSSGALVCQWRIIGHRGEHIRLNFTSMDMSSITNQSNDDAQTATTSPDNSQHCVEEYVEVKDGYFSESPLIGRYCGKSIPPTLVSLSRGMLIEYRRPAGQRSNGFVANYRIVCGTYNKADKGVIVSPSYESNYLPHKECTWTIEVPTGFDVVLMFDSFGVGEGTDCLQDYLEIHDGPSTSFPVIRKLCGYGMQAPVRSTNNTMTVHFVANNSIERQGFLAKFEKEVPCRKHLKAGEGEIVSPGYPERYPPSSECTWNIEVPVGNIVNLTFHSFEVESHENCSYDYLAVYDGPSTSSRLLEKLCGSTTPEAIMSTGNTMTLHFITDKVLNKKGFAANFSKTSVTIGTPEPEKEQ
ncbi:Bone morphoproteintic protein 1 [Sparganum proliferum]